MASQWILRKGRGGTGGRGFRYETAKGTPVTAAVRARIAAMAIPPAWEDVHVAVSVRSAVQAWGIDAKGRKQYRYHARAVERGTLRKYYRVRKLAHDLPAIRAALRRDFRRRGASRARVSAAVIFLIGEKFFRVGSDRYAKENKTFGISTLRKSHVTVKGNQTVFEYIGKLSKHQRQVVYDPELAAFVKVMRRAPGPRLFRYRSSDGWHDLTARDVNAYLHDTLGVPYTAKDFRTWGGTLRMATVLADFGPPASEREARRNVNQALRFVSAELGNTPAICRASYVHPLVIARYLDDGVTIRTPGGKRPASADVHAPEESALIAFLDEYFPERRRKGRD